MSMGGRAARLGVVVVALGLAAAGCGSKSTGGQGQPAGSTPPIGQSSGSTSGNGDAANNDTPKFASDFERTCADGIGFGGATAYAKTPKVIHPAVLMTKSTTDTWIDQEPSEYPSSWTLGYPKDVSKAELVVCYQRTKSISTGKTCQMTDDKTKQPFTLTLYNTEYKLQVLEARTGKVLLNKVGLARSTECPTLVFTSGDDDRTKYYTDLRPSDYRGLLKPYIAP
jgi:hypothetical protein